MLLSGNHSVPLKNGIKFKVRAVKRARAGTQNCYCSDGDVTVAFVVLLTRRFAARCRANGTTAYVRAPNSVNSVGERGTGPCTHMFCEYMINTRDDSKVLTLNTPAILESSNVLTQLTGESLGMRGDTLPMLRWELTRRK